MKKSIKLIPITIVTAFILFNACSKNQEDPPRASFTLSPDIARVGDTIYFQNTSDGAINFEWDFGDGNGSTQENPWHIYSENGTYSIHLTVTNTTGSDESTMRVLISSWSLKKDIPTARGMHSGSAVNGKIYIFSGVDHYGGGALEKVEEYNPETDTWTKKSDMLTARQCLTTSVVDGKIYAIGGGDCPNYNNYLDFVSSSTVEEYDPATDTWSTKSSMSTTRWDHSACVVDGKIYILGGSDSWPWEGIFTMEMYDPATDTWTSIETTLPRAIIGAGTAVVNGKIYVFGGELAGNGNRTDEYDPATNTWTQKTDMPTKRDDVSCGVLNGKIYVIGGESKTYEVLNTVEVYDPTTDTWTEGEPIIIPRWTHTSYNVNGKIYVISGRGESKVTPEVEVFYE
jgi:PKD repeat protein